MTEQRDPRLDLPGDAGPPVEGRRWFWIKMGAWAVAVAAVLLVATIATTLIGRLAGVTPRIADALLQVVEGDLPPPVPVTDDAETRSGDEAEDRGLGGFVQSVDPGGRTVVTEPEWVKPPNPDYPERAVRDNVTGEVLLRCRALATGEVAACEILSETPPDYGFARVTLKAVRTARLKPRGEMDEAEDMIFLLPARYRLG